MLFTVLTLLAYRSYSKKPDIKRYLLVALLFSLALMSKPMAVTLPCVLLLLDYWPLGRFQTEKDDHSNSKWRRLVLEKLPLLALSAASAVVTSIAQKAGGAMHTEYTLYNRVLNAFFSYARYLQKGVWPTGLAAFYPHPRTFSAWQVIISLIVLGSITAAVLACRKSGYLAVGWFWYLGTMIPVIGLVQVGEQGMADRYSYFPFIGLFVAVVWGIGDWIKKKQIPAIYPAAGIMVILISFSAVTYIQLGYWKNSLALWSRALAVTENNYVAQDSMGAELLDEGKPREAAAYFEAAIRINPKDAFSYLDLGVSEKRLGYTAAAVQNYKVALLVSADPALKATALGNMASISRAAGDYAAARRDYQNALALLPGNKYALIGLGLIAQKTGDVAQAAEYFSRAVKTEPTDAEYLLLSQALRKAGRSPEAQVTYDQARKASKNWDATVESVNHLLQE
jgi:tetratricopeptide (TPR) repeat protein